jgi:hypothetical protein
MLELAMTAACGYKVPAIGLEQAENFANFHEASISGAASRLQHAIRRCLPRWFRVTPNV